MHLAHCLDKHAAGAAGGVVDGFSGLGRKQGDHELHDLARGVELPGVLFLHVGKLFDQELVGVAHHIGAIVPVTEPLCRKVLH